MALELHHGRSRTPGLDILHANGIRHQEHEKRCWGHTPPAYLLEISCIQVAIY